MMQVVKERSKEQKEIHIQSKLPTTDEVQKMINTASKEAVCKDGCISCRYEFQAVDFIVKTA